ncbi:MAG: hypothetical protein Q8P80_01745 [Candidatus Levybacteria bacterium]|nr:hypothetical protein [Candidatus Levybacteria bacterium]
MNNSIEGRLTRREFINLGLLTIGGVLTLGGGIYGGSGVVEEREVWSKYPNATYENLNRIDKEITIFDNKVRDQILAGKRSIEVENPEALKKDYLEKEQIIKVRIESQKGREKSFLGVLSMAMGGMAFLFRK